MAEENVNPIETPDVDRAGGHRYNRTVDTHLLMNDMLFQIVFGGKDSARILQALLNALLGLKGSDRIMELTILKSDLDKVNAMQKGVVLDVVARDGRARLFDIEVQLNNRPGFVKRAYYYLSRLTATELQQGDDYRKLPRIVGVYLLDFTLFPDHDDVLSTYRLYDRRHDHEWTDLVELHFVELSKFSEDKPRNLSTPFEKWLHILKFAEFYRREDQVLPRELAEEEGIAMALDAMRDALTKEEVLIHMALRDKMARDEANSILAAREEERAAAEERIHREVEARKAAEERARASEQQARDSEQQARDSERQARQEVAREMLASGMDRATVLKLTHLRDEDLT